MTDELPDPVRVAIVEDSQIVRETLAEQIATMDGLCLAGTADSISTAAAVHLLDRLRAQKNEADADNRPALSAREAELLQLFAKGYSYKETARILSISPLTVGNHVRSIYRKLDVHTRGEAVYEAIRMGTLKIG